MRTLSGVQSSGALHLGNYYGAIRQFVQLQDEGEALYFIANLHALTSVRDGKLARALTHQTALAYLALGVDPKKAILFRQSDIPEITELFWILGTVVPVSNLERAVSYREKVEKGLPAEFGLFAYPVLMAVDILAYGSDVVPVGRDQVQHLEFTRDWATKFNMAYVPGYDPQDPDGAKGHPKGIFKLPAVRLQAETAVIPGTDGQKMSKSYNNAIELFGEEKDVVKRIKSIKTDSTPPEAPKPIEGAALYQLLKVMAPPEAFADIDQSWRAGGLGYGKYKERLIEFYKATFDGPRARYKQLENDPAEVNRILAEGALRARACAEPVVKAVRDAVGL